MPRPTASYSLYPPLLRPNRGPKAETLHAACPGRRSTNVARCRPAVSLHAYLDLEAYPAVSVTAPVTGQVVLLMAFLTRSPVAFQSVAANAAPAPCLAVSLAVP